MRKILSVDSPPELRLIYLHGFLSSPQSEKAQSFLKHACTQYRELLDQGKIELLVPELPHKPEQAIDLIESFFQVPARTVFIGSSLGGFYSIFFAQKYNCKAVLVNPLVGLQDSMAATFIGHHTDLYTGKKFEIEPADAEYLLTLEQEVIEQQDRYLLLLETGDDVLDYNLALEKFPLARQVVIQGGNHRFEHFEEYLTTIMEFADVSINA